MSQLDVQPSLADFELLAQVSQLLTVIDLDHVLERVIDLTARAVGAAKASLFLHHQDSDDWQRLLTTRRLEGTEKLQVVQSVLDKGLAGWVMRERVGAIIYDTEIDERWVVFQNDTIAVRSAMCLPLVQDDEVLAVITLTHPQPNHFTEHHLRLLTIVANQASVAVRNAQLFQRMQEQQRQLEAMLHAIPDVLLVINDEGNILLVNEPATALLGMDQNEVLGQSLGGLLHIDSAFAPLQELIDNPRGDGDTWTFETRSDRDRQDFTVTVSRWENPSMGTGGHVIVMHDVTTLRDLDRFKGEMLKVASHDLRSPLALIVGYCDLIAMDTPDSSSPIFTYLDVINRSTRRMNNLLDDMLRVEEIRTSPSELHKPTDFGDLVNKVIETMRMTAQTKNQSVEFDVQLGNLPVMTVDPVLIREAMENLVGNALKYTPQGGHILLQSYYDERRVHFIVQDNGIGIPEQDLPHIFEWGYRSKKNQDAPVEGKGLGLSLVNTVLERHRGEVWVESQEGVGSRFGFWLPR
jgi:PAS domain S-box-containing protein